MKYFRTKYLHDIVVIYLNFPKYPITILVRQQRFLEKKIFSDRAKLSRTVLRTEDKLFLLVNRAQRCTANDMR